MCGIQMLLLEEFYVGSGDVDSARRLDSLEPGRGVDLDDQRTDLGAEHVHAGDVEAEGMGGGDGGFFLGGSEVHMSSRASPMEVCPELTLGGHPLHGGDHLAPDDKGAEVGVLSLHDVPLHQDVG